MTETINPLVTSVQTPKRKRRFGTGMLVILGVFVVFGVLIALTLLRRGQAQPTSGIAPNFTFTTFNNQTMELADLRGKVVVLNFWASWCAPCAAEAPELQAAWEYYAPSRDVVFLGIAYADNGVRSIEFLEKYGITYLNAPDLGTRISRQYAIKGVPETFIIAPDGQIAHFIYASVTRPQLISLIEPLRPRGESSS